MSAYTCTPVYTHAYMNIPSIPRKIGAYAQIDKCISVDTYGYSVVDANIHFHARRHGTLLRLKSIGVVDLQSKVKFWLVGAQEGTLKPMALLCSCCCAMRNATYAKHWI